MADQARVDSIDVLREFRAALWKFNEVAKVALGDAESELGRTVMWLDTEMTSYWAQEVRKREQVYGRAMEKLREKRVFKDASGKAQSVVDEEKAVKVAKRRLEEAQSKALAVRKYVRVLQKAQDDYKGAVQGFSMHVAHDIPVAVARLDKLAGLLGQYVSLAPARQESAGAGSGADVVGGATAGGAAIGRSQSQDDRSEDLADFPSFQAPAVVVVQTHRPTGLVLEAAGRAPAADGNQYRSFESLEDAERFAQGRVAEDADIACAIYGWDRTVLKEVAQIVHGID